MFDVLEHKYPILWCFTTFWAKNIEVWVETSLMYSKLFLPSLKLSYENPLAVFFRFFFGLFFRIMLTSIQELG